MSFTMIRSKSSSSVVCTFANNLRPSSKRSLMWDPNITWWALGQVNRMFLRSTHILDPYRCYYDCRPRTYIILHPLCYLSITANAKLEVCFMLSNDLARLWQTKSRRSNMRENVDAVFRSVPHSPRVGDPHSPCKWSLTLSTPYFFHCCVLFLPGGFNWVNTHFSPSSVPNFNLTRGTLYLCPAASKATVGAQSDMPRFYY